MKNSYAIQSSKTGKYVTGLRRFFSENSLNHPNDYWIPEYLERQDIWTENLLQADLVDDYNSYMKYIPETEPVLVVVNN